MFNQKRLNQLFRYGCSLTNNETTAYDLLHDALEKFLNNTVDNLPANKEDHYIRTIMRNRYLDELRHQKRFPQDDFDDHEDSLISMQLPDPEKIIIDQELLGEIWSVLNPLERELLHLWAVDNYTAKEIAEQLDSPRGTVLSRIHRLRKKLESKLSIDSAATGDMTS